MTKYPDRSFNAFGSYGELAAYAFRKRTMFPENCPPFSITEAL
jgi:hypothetical protein